MAEQDGTCLCTVRAQLSLNLHPSRSGDPRLGLQEELNDLVMKYNETYGGVVLSYSDVVIQEKQAKILDGINPHFRIHLSATLLLFAPKVGSILDGVVHKTGTDYAGVHILGVFNAAIRGKDFVEQFECDEEWINPVHYSREDPDHQLRVGSRVRSVVTSVRVEMDDHIVIDAAVNVPGTGCRDWLMRKPARPSGSQQEEPVKKKKKRKERESVAEETVHGDAGVASSPLKKKRKRAVAAAEAATEPAGIAEEAGKEEEGSGKMNKKRKKRKVVDTGHERNGADEPVEEDKERAEKTSKKGAGAGDKKNGVSGKEAQNGSLSHGGDGGQKVGGGKEKKHTEENGIVAKDAPLPADGTPMKEKKRKKAVGGQQSAGRRLGDSKTEEDEHGREEREASGNMGDDAVPVPVGGKAGRAGEKNSKPKEGKGRKGGGGEEDKDNHGSGEGGREKATEGQLSPSGKKGDGGNKPPKTKKQKDR